MPAAAPAQGTVGTVELPAAGTPTTGANELLLHVPVELHRMQSDTRAFQVACALSGPGAPNALGHTVSALDAGPGEHAGSVDVLIRTDTALERYDTVECRLFFCDQVSGGTGGGLCDAPVPDQPGPLEPALAHRYYRLEEPFRGRVQLPMPPR